eukprot:jgi/Botrbrau1/7418/Bobra.0112s0018.1
MTTKVGRGFAYYVLAEGDPSAPAVLLLHGFPDSHKRWEFQVEPLVKAGYRVIAPDLLGAGLTDKPQEIEPYKLKPLADDVLDILEAHSVDRFYLIAHDWGSSLAFALTYMVPDRIIKMVTFSVGHVATYFAGPGGHKQRQASWYILFFISPEAEAVLMADDSKRIRELMGEGAGASPEDVQRQMEEIARPGRLTAGLNWYRANHTWDGFLATEPGEAPILNFPVMGVWGVKDIYCLEPQMLNTERYVKPGFWRYEKIADAGHNIMTDQPEEVNALLLDFLNAPLPE